MKKHTSSATGLFEIGDREYEVAISYFHPGEAPSRDCPGDGPEVSPENIVSVLKDGESWDFVTWEIFLLDFAQENRLTISKAEDKILEKLIENAMDEIADQFDERFDNDFDDRLEDRYQD